MGGLVEFVLLVGLVFGIVVYRRRADGRRVDVGLMARRLFEFGFLFGLVSATAVGATGALTVLYDALSDGRVGEPEELAMWLSLVIVAGLALLGMALWLRRRFRSSAAEAESGGWSLYLSAVDLVSSGMLVGSAINVIGWLVDGWSLNSWAQAALPVWFVVSVVHWRRPGTRRSNYFLFASGAALIGVVISTAVIVEHLLQWAYEGVMPDPLAFGYRYMGDTSWANSWDGVRGSIGPLVAFGAAWWWFWWRNARRSDRSPERDGYVLVVGVLGGLAATVVAAAGSLHTVLSWVSLASARGGSAVDHFDVLSIFATLLVIGLALWAYHRTEVPHAVARRAGGRDEIARLYDHLEAGVGLVASTVGLAVLIGIVLHKVMPAPDDWDRGVGELLVLALTMLAVGVPIWSRAWHRIQAHAGSVSEESSAVRRVYLFAVFGVTGLVVLGSILAMVYMVLFGLLDDSLDVGSVATFRIPLALIGATAGISVYHGRVLRSGLTSVPASSRPSLRTVTVVGPAASALLSEIGEVPGVRVVHHLRLDVAELVEADPANVLDVVRTGSDDMVVVVAGDGSIQVIPVGG